MRTFIALFVLLVSVLIPTPSFAYSLGVRTQYSTQSIFSTGWTQIVASLPQFSTDVVVGDSSNQAVLLGVGAPGAEVVQAVIPANSAATPFRYPLQIPAGARVSLKSSTSTVSSGEDDMSFFH